MANWWATGGHLGFRRHVGTSQRGLKRFCGEEILRKIIPIMSDAREEAAIAREALVREKKKELTWLLLKTTRPSLCFRSTAPNLLHLHELSDASGVTSGFTTLA